MTTCGQNWNTCYHHNRFSALVVNILVLIIIEWISFFLYQFSVAFSLSVLPLSRFTLLLWNSMRVSMQIVADLSDHYRFCWKYPLIWKLLSVIFFFFVCVCEWKIISNAFYVWCVVNIRKLIMLLCVIFVFLLSNCMSNLVWFLATPIKEGVIRMMVECSVWK